MLYPIRAVCLFFALAKLSVGGHIEVGWLNVLKISVEHFQHTDVSAIVLLHKARDLHIGGICKFTPGVLSVVKAHNDII